MADSRSGDAADDDAGVSSDDVSLTGHPARIGPYRVLQVLAQGGMGLVYVAEQSAPVRRRVALKVIRAGMGTREVIARFEVERQALAVMEHPNIAKVLDGGATEDGRPYFVMELVKGIPLTEYCDVHHLSTRARLALFIDVCHAVQHAHQKGVIHRDLKPSNVLVMMQDGLPVPKVIDFGIAKALAQPLTDLTLVTAFGQAIGTPAYMSPEQADPSALDVDTRTDIYSLGVMLFELLVGKLPMDPSEVGMPVFMVRLAQRETSPSTPSAKLSTMGTITGMGHAEVKALQRELRGDLDWIVMKALEPDRTRRYETVNGLALDITRFLHSEPVRARPPSALYRLSRFAKRNRGAVVAGTLVVLSLAVGLTVSAIALVRTQRAEATAVREAESARQVAGFLTNLFRVSDPGEARGNSVTAREILDRGADRIRVELSEQPLVQAQLLFTIGSVYRELGLFDQAQPLLEQAMTIRGSRLADSSSELQQNRVELARLAQQQGRFAEAESLFRKSIDDRERLSGPSSPELVPLVGSLGGMMVTRGRYPEAESLLTRAVALHTTVKAPEDANYARVLRNLASTYLSQGRYQEAEPLYRQALSMQERVLGNDHPEVGRTLSNLGIVYYFLERLDDAEREYRRAESVLSTALGDDHPNIASIHINLGEIAWKQGRLPDAESRLRRALAILQKRVAPDHPSMGTAEYDLANVLRDRGALAEAESRYRRALKIRETALGARSPAVAEVLTDYSKLLRQAKRVKEAEQMEERVRGLR